MVLDYDEAGRLVGIEIDNASTKVALKELTLSKLPIVVQTIAANLLRPVSGKIMVSVHLTRYPRSSPRRKPGSRFLETLDSVWSLPR